MCKALSNKSGYISIETIIVAGFMIVLGVWAMVMLYDKSAEPIAYGENLVYTVLWDHPELELDAPAYIP